MNLYITAQSKPDKFSDNVSKGDAKTYAIDFTPWQEDNSTITSATWTLESGNASIGTSETVNGVTSALITFADAGRSLISIVANTANAKKKAWLEIKAKDYAYFPSDYGLPA